jgi:TetR/AcrR family transcriptional repressor of uid operon
MSTFVSGHGAAAQESPSLLARALADVVGNADRDEPDPAVLDAAFELFCRHGIQRTTMDDVARRAGLSRITVYRRVSSKEALVEQVVLREFRRYLDQFLADISRADNVADRVVLGFVSSLRAVRSNALMSGVMTAEPQLLAPSIMGEGGRTLAVVSEFVAGQLRREQAAGNVAAAVDVDLAAELMVRLTMSMLLTPSALVDLDDDEQLGALARRYLVPMLNPAA